MHRAEVHLTEEQLEAVRAQALREDTSVSEVVRRAIDAWVRRQPEPSPREMRQRALAAAGQFGSGSSDGSVRHDDYLADAFGQ